MDKTNTKTRAPQSAKNLPNKTEVYKSYFFWSAKVRRNLDEVIYYGSVKEITGYAPEEIKHFPLFSNPLFYEDEKQKIKKKYSDFIINSDQNNAEFVYRIITKGEKIIWINESLSVKRDAKGKVKSFNAIVCNITGLKEKELNLDKKLESLKEANLSKDKFISILSHDLRAPFTSILGFSEILLNEPNLSHSDSQEYLKYINDSSQNQLQLINYLLDWSRLQTGRIKIDPQRLRAQSIIYNCVSSLTGNAVRKNIDIKVNADESIYVLADERLLTQVITNLLSNAIKFSHNESSIIISSNLFNDEYIEFVVKDHGTGISEQNKSKLFKIEKMFSSQGTKGEKGTGLGLSLVKEIIDKHGGEIWFYSVKGEGSEFHFTIRRSPNSILLVEDLNGDRLYYEKIIKDNFPFYQVISASNGYEAINIIFNKLPSLIVTDHEMPLMNGFQLVENLRKEDNNLNIPIIAIAANISDELKRSYLSSGISHILHKPVDSKLFVDKLRMVLN